MRTLWRDIRFGVRILGKHPGHTAAAAVALALGIGLTTAMFSIVYGVILRGLPFPGAERIMFLETANSARNQKSLAVDLADFLDWRKRQRSFEGLAAFDDGTFTLSGEQKPLRLDGASMTSDFLDLLRVKPLLGRGFLPGEDAPGAAPVVLLGFRVWQDRYNGDPHIVGRGVRVNGKTATVVGVMPEGFRFPIEQDLWLPLGLDPGKSERGKGPKLAVYGRLRDGVSLDQAAAEMSAIVRGLATEYPRTNKGLTAVVMPYTAKAVGKEIAILLYTMLGAVACVLLIACINVASLIMARAGQRTREIAIRSALGAGRRQVVAQILTESVLLASIGAGLGLGLARWGVYLFNAAVVEKSPPFWMRIELDPAALVFALAATLLAGLISGLVPAFQASKTDINEVLKDEGRGSTSLRLGWFSKLVVVAELALSCALLVGAGLMVKSVVLTQTVKLGFDQANVLTFRVPLFTANFPKPRQRAAFYQQVLTGLQGLPGVTEVGATTSLPTSGSQSSDYTVEGRAYASDADYPIAHSDVISSRLFASLHARVVLGREFGSADTAESLPVVIVNQSFARKVWPGQDPLGKRIRLARTEDQEPWRTVVGVVPDLWMDGLANKQPEGFYLPLAQSGPERLSFTVHTRDNPLTLVPAARSLVAGLDRDTPIYFVKSLGAAVHESRFFYDLFGGLFLIFGAAALILSAVGIYGVISFSVERRTHEIGLRMALGAPRGRVLGMLMKQGSLQLLWGLGCGLPAAWGLGLLLADFLFQVKPADAQIFSGVVALLSAVATLACLVPGQRATWLDPVVAIRCD
ncbi:MAG: ABC transporter permease [Acidobacteriota bacterium]|nr:ABC transporter permease [Acidobacteriota bacterium]